MKVSYTCMNTYTDAAVLQHTHSATPRSWWDPERGKQAFREALDLAAIADESGFDYVSVSEHHYTGLMVNPNPALTAAALTQVVKRAGIALLGPLASMNNPVRLAEEFAMLDQLSGGRLIAMPLRGTPNEFKYYNIDPEESRGRTEESMLLIKKALTELEPFAWKGKYFDFPIISVWPGPTQKPHMPLYSSANSIESGTFAAENGFGAACSYFAPPKVAELMQHYRDTAKANGWTPTPDQMLYRAFCVVGEDTQHAADLVGRFEGTAPKNIANHLPENMKNAGMAFGFLQFSGDPDALVDQFREFYEMTGVGVVDISFNRGAYTFEETVTQIRTFGREVLPRIKEIAPVSV